jgi:ABC-type sulfate transport system permease component
MAAGLDNLLFPALVESPVPLTNSRGVFSQSLGEFVMGAVLFFAKDFPRMVRNQEAGVWQAFDIDDVSRAYVPYLVALLIGLALLAAFPVLTLVLPRWLLGYKG